METFNEFYLTYIYNISYMMWGKRGSKHNIKIRILCVNVLFQK